MQVATYVAHLKMMSSFWITVAIRVKKTLTKIKFNSLSHITSNLQLIFSMLCLYVNYIEY